MATLSMALIAGTGSHPRVSVREKDEDDDQAKLVEMQHVDFNVNGQEVDDVNSQLKKRQGAKKRGIFCRHSNQYFRFWVFTTFKCRCN
jgi:hypothetical protein